MPRSTAPRIAVPGSLSLPVLCLSLLSVGVLSLSACPPPGASPDGGTEGEGEGEGEGDNGGVVDLGCRADSECGVGEVCDLVSGDCLAGFDCSSNPGVCNFCGEGDTDCGFGAATAFCDDAAGVCRRTKNTCESCGDAAECAGDPISGLPGQCIGGYCAQGCGTCPSGFACESGGCVPAENAGQCEGAVLCPDGQGCPDGTRCSDLGVCLVICDADAECEAGKICWLDPGPLLGQCLNGCPRGDTRMNNGALEVCYSNGRWGPPCPTEGETTGCPTGLSCDAAGVCVLPGCQSDNDCQLARTYCETTTGECVDGCNSDDDCGAFELCDDANTCQQQGCRGKDVSCNLGEFCCGHENYTDPTSCPAPVEEGSCFLAPDPFCRECEDNDDCADIMAFGFSSQCFELQREDENGETVTIGKFCSVGCNSNADCPRGIPCVMDIDTDGDEVGDTNACIAALCAAVAGAR